MIIPRCQFLDVPLQAHEKAPVPYGPGLLDDLPAELTALTGRIRSVELPPQGACNLFLRLSAERGAFALKVARGEYRSRELWAEHTVMQMLQGGPVPVPASLAYVRRADLSYQLREYVAGEPLSGVLSAHEAIRPAAIREMARALAAIHRVQPAGAWEWEWEKWITASLEQAERNLESGACDPEDFSPDAPPAYTLDWLRTHRPATGPVSLLHGDFRPKNVLWREGRVAAVIDWAFIDIGDPYYDLSIIDWYMQGEDEWQQFLAAYGLAEFDQQRFDYYMALHKFLNV